MLGSDVMWTKWFTPRSGRQHPLKSGVIVSHGGATCAGDTHDFHSPPYSLISYHSHVYKSLENIKIAQMQNQPLLQHERMLSLRDTLDVRFCFFVFPSI